MSLGSHLFDRLLSKVAARIGGIARGLFGRILDLLGSGKPTSKALQREILTASGPVLDLLSEALTKTTGAPVTPAALNAYSIGEVTLSEALYHNARQTSATVQAILTEHARYAHDARKLALDLYEGYGFRETETLAPKVRLPKYLNDAALNRKMDALLAKIQASRLKTAPLRAGYLEALEKILADKGEKAQRRALQTAVEERYRYFANRIAQTELARAQNVEIAREMMADDEIQVVRIRLSGTHPAPDLCDIFAKADRYGLGPGRYPKALAPKPPFHSWCKCVATPELFKSAERARYNSAADAAYLRTLDPRTAARVAGSRAKRDEILMGANAEALWNAKRPEAYRIGRVGDAMLADVKPSAFEIAKSGGRHAGFLKDHSAKSDAEVARSIRSLRSQVETHRDKIANPLNWVAPGLTKQHMDGLVNSYWPKEIANFTQQIEILESILMERKP